MPEIMQLGPDDNDINPYLTPCPDDYPPCPLCGNHPDMLESGHIICCNIIVDSSDAWFLLPRALRWTHEPPKVAGLYMLRAVLTALGDGQYGPIQLLNITQDMLVYSHRKDFQWAGPIPQPIEP